MSNPMPKAIRDQMLTVSQCTDSEYCRAWRDGYTKLWDILNDRVKEDARAFKRDIDRVKAFGFGVLITLLLGLGIFLLTFPLEWLGIR